MPASVQFYTWSRSITYLFPPLPWLPLAAKRVFHIAGSGKPKASWIMFSILKRLLTPLCQHNLCFPIGQGTRLVRLNPRGHRTSIDEILKGLSRPPSRYQTVRKTLQRMVQNEQLVRLDRGRYAAARGALQGEMAFLSPDQLGTAETPGGFTPCPQFGR